jgi:hypothetical protein
LLVIVSCADPFNFTPTPPTPDEEQDTINHLVEDENEYRDSWGSSLLTTGLTCTLYTISGGSRIQVSIPGHTQLTGKTKVTSYLYKGEFNQPNVSTSLGLNVLPTALKNTYKNMYYLQCVGFLVATASSTYQFDLTSDDASLLYVSGAKVIDNDNNHGATLVTGSKYLRKGVHSFKLEYAQAGGGSQALILKMNSALLNPKYLYHD